MELDDGFYLFDFSVGSDYSMLQYPEQKIDERAAESIFEPSLIKVWMKLRIIW